MSLVVPGFESLVRVIPQSAGTKFKSAANPSGEAFDSGSNSEIIEAAYSGTFPTNYETLDQATFEDVAQNIGLGLKSGDWSVDLLFDDASTGYSTIKAAHDDRESIEIAWVPTTNVPVDAGYEMTAVVPQFEVTSSQSERVEVSLTFQCNDGDGWSPLQTA